MRHIDGPLFNSRVILASCRRLPTAPPAPGTGVAAQGAMKVLVIEDNQELRDYLRVALEASGHTVLTALHGQEGIAYLNGHPVDVVLTDLFMPEMDGIEVIATLRHQFPGVRIVAMSG